MSKTIGLEYRYTPEVLRALIALIDRHAGDDYAMDPQQIDYADLKRLREFRVTIEDTLIRAGERTV